MKSSAAAVRTKQLDARSYDLNAAAFDELTQKYSTSLASFMIELARLKPDDTVLDVGSGTGLVLLQAATLLPAGRAIGIDHSEAMLDHARAKASAQGLSGRVELRAMDAEALDFPSGAFDAIVSLFVLRHLPHPKVAVNEMFRVSKAGTRIVLAVGGRPALFSASGLRAAVQSIRDRTLIGIGRRAVAPGSLRKMLLREGVPAAHNHAATAHMADVASLLRESGFQSIERRWRGEAFDLQPDEFWRVQATFDSEARGMLDGLSAARVDELRTAFIERAQAITAAGGKLVYRTGADVFSARRV